MVANHKIGIIDCGISNLGSIQRAVLNLGFKSEIISGPDELSGKSNLIFPGQGSFKEGMKRIFERGWLDAIRNEVVWKRTPILGICLGMHLFSETGIEGGNSDGLFLLKGKTRELPTSSLRIPHIGWNSVQTSQASKLFKGVTSMTDFYFSHSYVFESLDERHVCSKCDYGGEFVASVEVDNIFGTQFHPEKSSKAGRLLLKNFCEFELC